MADEVRAHDAAWSDGFDFLSATLMTNILDVAGIGAGPFNLSVAALLAPVTGVQSQFFDRRQLYDWHPGMMLPGARLQTSFLKDLVSAADPTSPYSFLAYLVTHGRFYRFINAEFGQVERREFADYLRWVASRLPNLSLRSEVQEIVSHEQGFALCVNGQWRVARRLVLATGNTPRVPSWAPSGCDTRCLHTHHYMTSPPKVDGQRVLVIGGGQSGAEVVIDLLSRDHNGPRSLTWVSRRQTLEALDESPFTNEFFTPHYVHAFHGLPAQRKREIVERQKLASDGISPDTLKTLYQLLYSRRFLQPDRCELKILPQREVFAMNEYDGGWRLQACNQFDGATEVLDADTVILATGYETVLPLCLEPLRDRLKLDDEGRFVLARDFSVEWVGEPLAPIYVQNGGRYSHGISDPQLSLAAWRAATIVNGILGEQRYATGDAALPIEWASCVA